MLFTNPTVKTLLFRSCPTSIRYFNLNKLIYNLPFIGLNIFQVWRLFKVQGSLSFELIIHDRLQHKQGQNNYYLKLHRVVKSLSFCKMPSLSFSETKYIYFFLDLLVKYVKIKKNVTNLAKMDLNQKEIRLLSKDDQISVYKSSMSCITSFFTGWKRRNN